MNILLIEDSSTYVRNFEDAVRLLNVEGQLNITFDKIPWLSDVNLVQLGDYDAIVCDLWVGTTDSSNLINMGGIDTIVQIRSRNSTIKIFAWTYERSESVKQKVVNELNAIYVHKSQGIFSLFDKIIDECHNR